MKGHRVKSSHLLNTLVFNLKRNKSKFYDIFFSTSFLIVVGFSGIFALLSDYQEDNFIVTTISLINFTCIFSTLIFISIKNILFAFTEKYKIFDTSKCFDAIDETLQDTFAEKPLKGNSRLKHSLTILLIFSITVVATFVRKSEFLEREKEFYLFRCIYAFFVCSLGVKISAYCMLVKSIKTKFDFLRKHETGAKLIDGENVEKVKKLIYPSNLQQFSSIYDETLEIISFLNDSFSPMLSTGLSKFENLNA